MTDLVTQNTPADTTDTSRSTMRRAVVTTDGVQVLTVDVPQPLAGEARVRSHLVGICGSDVHAAAGEHPFVHLPYHPGHEVVGVVDAIADDVVGVAVGQRVVVEPDLPCWTCKMCTSGRQNLCENLQFFGCGWDQGGLVDYFTISANQLHTVPDHLDDHAAVLIEPLSTPVHAVRLAGDLGGRAVAVIGAGTIALLVLHVVRAAGARCVVVTDVLEDKRLRARAAGADAAVDATAPDAAQQVRAALGESADVVFDCVAVQSTVDLAVGLASKGGTVVIVGVPVNDIRLPLALIQDHQIRIQGSATYLPTDYDESIRLLHGTVQSSDIISAMFPLNDAQAAFTAAASGSETKVVVTMT